MKDDLTPGIEPGGRAEPLRTAGLWINWGGQGGHVHCVRASGGQTPGARHAGGASERLSYSGQGRTEGSSAGLCENSEV